MKQTKLDIIVEYFTNDTINSTLVWSISSCCQKCVQVAYCTQHTHWIERYATSLHSLYANHKSYGHTSWLGCECFELYGHFVFDRYSDQHETTPSTKLNIWIHSVGKFKLKHCSTHFDVDRKIYIHLESKKW